MKEKASKIIVIVAPSGTGKSTLIKRIKNRFSEVEESVSFTTRPMRKGEVHGENYFFISEEEFLERKKRDDFLEWAIVHSKYYGTSKDFVEERLASGAILLFDLDVQGAEAFRRYFGKKAEIIFLEPPSLEELEKRLLNRATEHHEVIAERVNNAREELKKKNQFDYLVLNDDIEKAYSDLEAIFKKIIEGGPCR